MGGLAERQVQLALQAQEQFDSELVKQIKETEKSVNAWEIRIDELVAEIIARRQPTASDLRLFLAVSKIVLYLERAGDEANKVAYMAQQAAESPRFSTVGAIEVRAIGERVAGMLSDALTAFARLDVDMALQVARNDKDVDAIYQ